MATFNKGHSKQYTNSNSRNKIFIGGLAGDISESIIRYNICLGDLMYYFEQYSKIDDCVVMIDKITNHSRGFGFITIEDSLKVDTILNSQPHIIKGKKVECKKAIPKEVIQNQNEQINEDILRRKQSNDIQFYSRKLFVGGLPLTLTEEEMIKYFSQYGEVESCLIKKEEDTGKSRGFGFILFLNKESINNVLAYGQNHYILGKWIECKQAHPKEFQELQNNINNNNNSRYPPYQNNLILQQNNKANFYLNQNAIANRWNNEIKQNMNSNINQINPIKNSNNTNATNNNNSLTEISNQINQPSDINQIKLFQYLKNINNNSFPSLNRRSEGNLNLNNINMNKNQSLNIQSQTNDSSCLNEYEDRKNSNNNNMNSMITNPNVTPMINQTQANAIEDNNLCYFPTRDIDTFSYYFNNCIKNPECNSYINYKLFDLSGEEVSKLAYENSAKVQLFSDDNNRDVYNEDKYQFKKKNKSIEEFANADQMHDYNHWKQTKNFRLKTDRLNNENLNGSYKPY